MSNTPNAEPFSPLRLYNTLGRQIQVFEPLSPDRVLMYTCGPTVYGPAHIGNLRSFLTADLVRRVIEYNGFAVVHVKNITDVGHLRDDVAGTGDDKIEDAARAAGTSPQEIAEMYSQGVIRDEERLNILPPHHRPKATEYIPEMIAMTERLVETGSAYVATGNVYFDVRKFEPYGELSGNRLEDLVAGQRVEIEPDKANPVDFALWKAGDPGRLMNWNSPWGTGFPGWHIECSAMIGALLGDQIDVHTGGVDNIFPHHEDERAQSESLHGKPFVKYWIHGAHLQFGAEKMSKSLGNIATLSELMEQGVDPLAFRYFLLQAHYRKPLSISKDSLSAAVTGLERIWDQVAELWQSEGPPGELKNSPLRASFVEAINDDIGTPRALAVLQQVLETDLEASDKLALLADMDTVLGLDLIKKAEERSSLTREQQDLLSERLAARNGQDWTRSDELREQLSATGVEIRDVPGGQRWVRRNSTRA